MPKTMLIDATHSEETRVAVVDGNRLVEFDYESKVRKQLKGGIFLAKVTRVEPSLQAAFVNFGGNRHGFLPFSEIHPDYFRIPVADRDALLAAQMAELEEHDEEMEQQEAEIEQRAARVESGIEEEEEEDIEAIVEVGGEDQPLTEDDEEGGSETAEASREESEDAEQAEEPRRPIAMNNPADVLEGPMMPDPEDGIELSPDDVTDYAESSEDEQDEDYEEEEGSADSSDGEERAEGTEENAEGGEGTEGGESRNRDRNRSRGRGRSAQGGRGRGRNGQGGRGRGRNGQGGGRGEHDDHSVDSLGGDSIEGDRPFRFNMRKSYKIQEVIKRGQIMLIQVSKEERGNKGAAVTTYLSLPGRYCVLMPNSPRGGGVSRKIASFKDRKRMKDMLDELSVPEGMSVILRTAGVARTKVEIKRDLDYLTRLWNTIREHTLQSSAPALIYEEGNLIKRAIRDLYTRDIEDVYVQGDEGHRTAKEFMKMLMPSHAKKVQEYKDARIPLFHKFGVESQISDIGEPTVNLRSGGYLVINPTEALVSIDVNSGRATKERHIEETALKTNLEAADELARQLRLRDLGGLVVVDFIDMEDRRNNRKVEQRLRDALSSDRARIQVGRISSFGLLELSRQRLNPSLAESQTEICAHCAGIGRTRTLDFAAISIIRALEAEGIKGKGNDMLLIMGPHVALYILNNKRRLLNEIEQRYGFEIIIETDAVMSNTQFTLEGVARSSAPKVSSGITVAPPSDDNSYDETEEDEESEGNENAEEGTTQSSRPPRRAENDEDGEGGPRRRRGRRGGRGRRPGGRESEGQEPSGEQQSQPEQAGEHSEQGPQQQAQGEGEAGNDSRPPRRDRGERGGRGRRNNNRDRRPREGQTEGGNAQGSSSEPSTPGERSQSTPSSVPETFVRTQGAASNDERRDPPAPRDYEVINQAPEKKKKGWWNKLVE